MTGYECAHCGRSFAEKAERDRHAENHNASLADFREGSG